MRAENDELDAALRRRVDGMVEAGLVDELERLAAETKTKTSADPAEVARKGWDAMMAGEGHIVPGLKNKAQVAGSGIVPQAVLAEAHRKIAEPGSGHR